LPLSLPASATREVKVVAVHRNSALLLPRKGTDVSLKGVPLLGFFFVRDVQMKGLSGIELQERLIGEGRRTPIIFVTAILDERIRKQVLEAGAIDILSKPFSDQRLAGCLDSALNDQ
jgi:CheY-like chemotaxis protein